MSMIAASQTVASPVIPEFLGGSTGWVAGLVGLIALAGVLWVPVRALLRLVKALVQFIEDWNGTPPRTDSSGAVIEPERPGVPAMLETVRAQVENSHQTNLRDDLDELQGTVRQIRGDLSEHIRIAKEAERRQDETARKVDRLARKWGGDP